MPSAIENILISNFSIKGKEYTEEFFILRKVHLLNNLSAYLKDN